MVASWQRRRRLARRHPSSRWASNRALMISCTRFAARGCAEPWLDVSCASPGVSLRGGHPQEGASLMRFTHTRLIPKLGAAAAAALSITFIAAGPALAGTTGHTKAISGDENLFSAVYR